MGQLTLVLGAGLLEARVVDQSETSIKQASVGVLTVNPGEGEETSTHCLV